MSSRLLVPFLLSSAYFYTWPLSVARAFFIGFTPDFNPNIRVLRGGGDRVTGWQVSHDSRILFCMPGSGQFKKFPVAVISVSAPAGGLLAVLSITFRVDYVSILCLGLMKNIKEAI